MEYSLENKIANQFIAMGEEQTWKKPFFVHSEILYFRFGEEEKIIWIATNLKWRHKSVNPIFNPNEFFFFFLTVAIWYYHAIYRLLKRFASLTGYEDVIFDVFSNSHVQESKFGGYIHKFGGKSKKKLKSPEFIEFFSPSLVKRTIALSFKFYLRHKLLLHSIQSILKEKPFSWILANALFYWQCDTWHLSCSRPDKWYMKYNIL